MDNIVLKEPSVEIKDKILEFAKEGRENSGLKYPVIITKITDENIDEFLLKLNNSSKGIELKDDQVPSSWFFVFKNDDIVGTINLRHSLSEKLFYFGGHIGYFIKEQFRGIGIATKALSLCIDNAKGLGIDSLLLQCYKDNIASRRVIEKNGGIAESDFVHNESGKLVTRFWIDIKD
jgi:predicted acetyltransferase